MKTGKKLFAVLIFLVLSALLIYIFYSADRNLTVTKQFFSMDTAVRLSAKEEQIDTYIAVIKKLDKALSAYDKNSEIYKLNENGTLTVSDQTAELFNSAKRLSRRYPQVNITAGALTKLWNVTSSDPVIPEKNNIEKALNTVDNDNLIINGNEVVLKNNAQLDLGSCAKGYALDLLFDEFEKNEENCAVVSFGSSTLLYGEKSDGKPFTTAVANPEDSNSQVLKFTSSQCFVSTSGGYERYFEAEGKKYCHIIDLKTGYPVETDLTSVTVVSAENGLLTDFLSTCVYMGGTKKLDQYLNNSKYQIIALDKNKKIYCSDSIKESIEILDNSYSF